MKTAQTTARTAREMFYFVDDVQRMLGYSRSKSYKIIKQLNDELEAQGKAFENIFTMTNDLENLNVDTAPALYRLRCNDGSWVQIMSVPGFDKGRLRTFCPGMDKEAENFNATALINDTIMGLAGRCDKSIPTILTAHYTVAGAEADNGSTFLAGQDVVVLPATIDAAGVDLACLGHIHRPQKIACNTPAYYCGCINELTFNDEAIRHGFYIHTMDGHGIVKSEFHELESSRKHYTMRIDCPQIMQFIADGTLNIAADQVYGKIVRVRYSCTSEEEKALNKAELQQKLMQMGAFYISDILPEDVEELDAKDQLTEHDGPTEALSRWLDLNNVEPWQKARLMELAAPIIARADHGMDDGHSTGAFLPISIEVKNYRSYTDAAFSFEPVHMAMVNGANGVGKGAAVMRRKRAHRMRVLEMPEDDLHVRIPVPIGKTVYRVHPNPACHYGVRAAERAVFGRVITPRYVVTPVPFAVEMMREWNRTVFARVLDAERRAKWLIAKSQD